MRPFKHAEVVLSNQGDSSEPKDQYVQALALARLQTANGEVPLVAQAFSNAIALSYWKFRANNIHPWTWAYVQRAHTRIEYFGEDENRKEQSLSQASRMEWSQALGLAAHQETVFLAYKRHIKERGAQLFMERLQWDEADQILGQESLFAVPLGRFGIVRAGYYHWLGVYNGQLAVVLQAWRAEQGREKPVLAVLMTSGDIKTADLSQREAWHAPLVIDDGGWDFDVRMVNEILHIVYREEEYPLQVKADIERGADSGPGANYGPGTQEFEPIWVDISSPDIFHAFYRPLKYARVSIPSRRIEEIKKDLPGGEHPQIQSLDPLCLTADRVQEGGVRVINQLRCDRHRWWRRTRWFVLQKTVRDYEKILIQEQPGQWAVGRLRGFPSPLVPRNRTGANAFQECVMVEKIPGSRQYLVQLATLDAYDPVWKVFQGTVAGQDTRSEAIDFLEHDNHTGTVLRTRYLILPGPNLMPRFTGYAVLDINHGSIPPPLSFDPRTNRENTQFAPWQIRRPDDEDRTSRHIVPGNRIGDLEDDTREIDNTIGGCLVADRGLGPMQFYAYTDLGDGQCRVIFEPDLAPPEPRPAGQGKDLIDPYLTGAQASGTGMVELTHGLGWDPITMKRYPILNTEARLSGMDTALDTLLFNKYAILGVGDSEDQTNENFYENTMREFEAFMENAAGGNTEEESAPEPEAGLPRARFRYSPPDPFPGSMLVFDAATSLSGLEVDADEDGVNDPDNPADTSLTYLWIFDDGVQMTGAQITRRLSNFEQFGLTRTVTLVVTNSLGQTGALEASIRFQPSLWDELWRTHTELNTQSDMYALRNCEVDFSKYTISYFVNADGSRDHVNLRVKERWDAFRLFVGEAYQQGGVDLRLPMQIQSADVDMLKEADALVTCNKLKVNLAYIRRFTPGVLMSDLRHNRELTNAFSGHPQQLLWDRPAGLACKPQEDTRVEFEKAEVSLSFNWGGNLIGAVIDLLLALGLGWVVLEITGTLAAISAASVIPVIGWGIAAGLWAGLVYFIHNEVPKIISGQVQGMIENSINSADFKANLDNAGLMVNAGEGLAESIAVSALTQINGEEPEPTGKNRMAENLWEMIYVTSQKCRVYYRKPGE